MNMMPTCISTYSESKGRKEQVFENKELRKIFGHNIEGGCKFRINKKLNDIYRTLSVITVMK
jgi:hypothetical protein